MEVGGVCVSAGRRYEHAVLFGFVATEQQHVPYAEKLQVDEFVFDALLCCSAANDVRYHGYSELSPCMAAAIATRTRTAAYGAAAGTVRFRVPCTRTRCGASLCLL